jgi:hypothetical protein
MAGERLFGNGGETLEEEIARCGGRECSSKNRGDFKGSTSAAEKSRFIPLIEGAAAGQQRW